MASLVEYIQRVHSEYPGNLSSLDPFSKANIHAPTLLKGQTNRILVYKGSFSPPHVGHLALLKHAFEHGGRDLNMIAGIVKPLEGCERPSMANCSGKVVSFSVKERAVLWKSDERLPEWAWVYEDSMDQLWKLMYCLVKMTKEDGYDLEFVALYGSDHMGWLGEPSRRLKGDLMLIGTNGERRYATFRGCDVTLICDAARKTVEFDMERLEKFEGDVKWMRPVLDAEVSIREEMARAKNLMAVLKEKDPGEYQRLVDEAGSEAAAVGERAITSVAEGVKDNQHIIAQKGEGIVRRFVRLDRSAPGFQETLVSGSIVRNAIETEEEEKVCEVLQAMALSPELLGEMLGLKVSTGEGGDCDGAVDKDCAETSTGATIMEEESKMAEE